MRWANLLRLCRLPLPERTFVLCGIAAIVAIRLAVILVTPHSVNLMDPRIYQGAGQTVLAGVNPYDFADRPEMRAALRAKMAGGAADDFTETQASWDYYVSGNLPASTAMYALFETIAHGSRFIWRLLFILGDIGVFLGLLALLNAVRRGYRDARAQAGVLCIAVINPVSIVAGCAIPEDKQFQTMLMLVAAALLLSPAAATLRRAFATGLVLSLSVLFKLLGIFLLPLWLVRARKEGSRFALWSVLGALVPAAAAFLEFGHKFIGTMANRGVRNSVVAAEHASPWVLLPWLGGTNYLIAKAAVVTLFGAALAALYAKRRIDLLNLCAGLMVAFVCIWLDKGAMNRINMAVVFAVAAMASLSGGLFAYFSAAIVLAGTAGYALGVGLLRVHLESVDAVLALIFVFAYLAALAAFASGARPRSQE